MYQRRQWHPISVLLPGKSHGRKGLVGCSPWGLEESDTTERLHFHFSLSCIGEGNGNPLQCSCLENPRDGGAWWAVSMGSHRVGHDWSDSAAAAAATVIYIALVKENTFITTNTKITQWTLTLKFYGKKGNEWSEQKYRSSWLKALPFKYTSAKARLLYIQISHSKVTAVDRWDLSSRRIKAAQQVVIIWSIMAVRLV